MTTPRSSLSPKRRRSSIGVAMLASGVSLLGSLPAPAQPARAASQNATAEDALEEVVVTGRREPGMVIGDIAPETQLSSEEIRALGVSSVAELLTALGPQLGSSRGRGGGRPVVLINGVRVSGFGEIRDLPTEAILRTDIFPEEVALKYGYRADQRVVNIVLRPRFKAFTGEFGARGTTEGGREGADLNASWLDIRRDDRWQVDLKARRDEELLESQRNVIGASGTRNADAALRSLAPATDQLTANFVLAKPFAAGSSFTLNATLDDTARESLLGLRPSATGPVPLRRDADTLDSHLGGIVQGARRGWRWSATLNADRSDSTTTLTGGANNTSSRTDSADLDLVLNGSAFDLPAGAVGITLKGSAGTRSIDSVSQRLTSSVLTDLSRDQRELQLNVDLPLWRGSGDGEFTPRLGANFNQSYEDISDVGGLQTTGFGFNWSTGRLLRVIASMTDEQGAPTMQQLGGAIITTPFVRSFDFVRGETVEITRIDGGNASLSADRREVLKLGIGSRPFEDIDLDLNADYVRSRSRDVISGLPLATPDLERAFRDRFSRDASGRLLTIDARPVNFFGRDRDELRLTINLTRPWGPQPEAPSFPSRGNPGSGGAPTTGAPVRVPASAPADDAARRARMAQMGERFLAFSRRGSLQFTLTYTERLADEITIARNLPTLDLLGGETLFDSTGNPRRELEAQFGANRNGFGARVITQWRSGSAIKGNSVASSTNPSGRGDLDFSALTTVNLRLFADLGLQPWARDHQFLRGARVSLVIGNLFNERQKVRAADGSVPVNYQPDLLDPQGRNVRLNFRKLFFPNFTPPGGRAG